MPSPLTINTLCVATWWLARATDSCLMCDYARVIKFCIIIIIMLSRLMWLWAEETESSVDFNIISLKSKISGLPRALIANLQATILGKHQHVAEVSDILVLYFIWCNKCFFYSSVCLRMAGLKYAIRRRKLAAAALAIFSRTLQLHCEVRLLSCIIMYYHVISWFVVCLWH